MGLQEAARYVIEFEGGAFDYGRDERL